jgi:hypothetical protein
MSSNYTELSAQVSQITGLIERGVFFFIVLILTLIVARAILTSKRQKKPKKVLPTPMKTCPDCAEQVQMAARICRFCRHDFNAWSANDAPPSNTGS